LDAHAIDISRDCCIEQAILEGMTAGQENLGQSRFAGELAGSP